MFCNCVFLILSYNIVHHFLVSVLLCILHDIGMCVCALPSPPYRISVQDVKRRLCAIITCNFMLFFSFFPSFFLFLFCVSFSLQSELVLICFLVDVIIFCCLYFKGSCNLRLDSCLFTAVFIVLFTSIINCFYVKRIVTLCILRAE